MSNEPIDTKPAHDKFIPDPDEAEYPSTPRITSLLVGQAQVAVLERIEQWKQGERVPYVVNLEDQIRLRQLLTGRRIELPEEVIERPPKNIRALANRLEHDVHDAHDGPHLPAEYDIVHLKKDGRAKKPYVPYDTVRVEVEFGLPCGEGSSSPVSAQLEIRGHDFLEPIETFLMLSVIQRCWDADY